MASTTELFESTKRTEMVRQASPPDIKEISMFTKFLTAVLLVANCCGKSPVNQIQVDVWLDSGDLEGITALDTQHSVSRIFAGIGIGVVWHIGRPPAAWRAGGLGAPCTVFFIQVVRLAPASTDPTALASAHLFSGCSGGIVVYLDRVRELTANDWKSGYRYLACIFAHELGHAMQHVDRHSASGIMRAQWSGAEYGKIRRDQLAFTEEDVALIHLGLGHAVRGK